MLNVEDEIDYDIDDLSEDLDTKIREAIETEQADKGWRGNDYCPRCSKSNARQFAQEQDADDYCSRDKSQDIY